MKKIIPSKFLYEPIAVQYRPSSIFYILCAKGLFGYDLTPHTTVYKYRQYYINRSYLTNGSTG